MAMPTLRYGDGFADVAPDLRDFVKILQLGLKNLGYSINTDGLFSRETENVVVAFQQSKNLPDDGIVRETTWNLIAQNIKVRRPEVNIPIDTSSESQYPVLKYRDGYSTTTPHLSGAVKKLQSLLKQLGYSIFEDGLFNKTTEDAVKSFQRSVGIPNNGIVRENTWQALEQQINSAPPPTTKYPLLKLWDGFANSNPHLRGDVKRLQEALRKLGYAVDVDGLFGMDTEDAVKDFQLANELKTDGVVDKTTWQALEQTADLGYPQTPAKPSTEEETPSEEDIEVSSYSAEPPEPTAYSGYPDRGADQSPPSGEAEKSARGYPDRGSESYPDRGTESPPDQGSSGGYPDRGSESYPDRGSSGGYPDRGSSGGYPDRGSSGSYPDRETEIPPDQGSSGGSPDWGSGGYGDRGEYEDQETETIPDESTHPTLKYKDGFPDTTPHLNDDVQYLQQLLNKHGYSVDTDGLFGKGTEDAVKSFQRSQGLTADGIVGKSTWSALEEEPAGGLTPEPPETKPPDTVGPTPPDPGPPGGSILYYPSLRKNDGFSDNNPHLNRDVRRLQIALNNAGFSTGADGMFGSGTEGLVKDFQKEQGIQDDGVVRSDTWKALERYDIPRAESPVLKYFWGDSNWVHNWEGHNGSAYWPGGSSGVTLDPGMDLGHANPSLIEDLYKPILTADQYRACTNVFGIKGDAAKAALDRDPVLKSIRISRAQADDIFDYAAVPYWDGIVNRFNTLIYPDTLASVQTALLSLSYNRGYGNSDLEQLQSPLERKDWWEVANRIGNMQQDHSLEGIRKRRRAEGELIKWELNWLAEYV